MARHFFSRGSADPAPGADHGNGIVVVIEVVNQFGLHMMINCGLPSSQISRHLEPGGITTHPPTPLDLRGAKLARQCSRGISHCLYQRLNLVLLQTLLRHDNTDRGNASSMDVDDWGCDAPRVLISLIQLERPATSSKLTDLFDQARDIYSASVDR